MPSAALAAQTDIRAEAVYEPVVAAARVSAPKTHDVAESEFDDSPISGRH
jgi:hypothetical protein